MGWALRLSLAPFSLVSLTAAGFCGMLIVCWINDLAMVSVYKCCQGYGFPKVFP